MLLMKDKLSCYVPNAQGQFTDGGHAKAAILQAWVDGLICFYKEDLKLKTQFVLVLNELTQR